MLGQLYIKAAMVSQSRMGMAMPGIGAARQEAEALGNNQAQGIGATEAQLHPWGQGPMGRMGVFDPSRPEWVAAQSAAAAKPGATRTRIPADVTHRDMFGNFYIQDKAGNYDRLAVNPASGQLSLYPIETTTEGTTTPATRWGSLAHRRGFADSTGNVEQDRVEGAGVPGLYTRGRGETRESMGGQVVPVEQALGLTDVRPAVAAGATHVDQAGQFFTGEKADMVPMDQANPQMAKNYRMNGQEPPMVDRSRSTTKDRFRANPTNDQTAAAEAAQTARQANPAYRARMIAMYDKAGLPQENRPSWLQQSVTSAAAAPSILQDSYLGGVPGNNAYQFNPRTPMTSAATAPAVMPPAVSPTPTTTAAVAPSAAAAPPAAAEPAATTVAPPTSPTPWRSGSATTAALKNYNAGAPASPPPAPTAVGPKAGPTTKVPFGQ